MVAVAGVHHESLCQDECWWAKAAQVKIGEQAARVLEPSAAIILALRLLWSISAQLFAGNCLTARLSEGEKKPLYVAFADSHVRGLPIGLILATALELGRDVPLSQQPAAFIPPWGGGFSHSF